MIFEFTVHLDLFKLQLRLMGLFASQQELIQEFIISLTQVGSKLLILILLWVIFNLDFQVWLILEEEA